MALTHAWDFLLEEDKWKVEDQPTHNKQEGVEKLNLWSLNDWSQNQEHGNDKCNYWEDDGALKQKGLDKNCFTGGTLFVETDVIQE